MRATTQVARSPQAAPARVLLPPARQSKQICHAFVKQLQGVPGSVAQGLQSLRIKSPGAAADGATSPESVIELLRNTCPLPVTPMRSSEAGVVALMQGLCAASADVKSLPAVVSVGERNLVLLTTSAQLDSAARSMAPSTADALADDLLEHGDGMASPLPGGAAAVAAAAAASSAADGAAVSAPSASSGAGAPRQPQPTALEVDMLMLQQSEDEYELMGDLQAGVPPARGLGGGDDRLLRAVGSSLSAAASWTTANVAAPLATTVSRTASSVLLPPITQAASATLKAVSSLRSSAGPNSPLGATGTPASSSSSSSSSSQPPLRSSWFIADDIALGIRYFVVNAPADLGRPAANLVPFEPSAPASSSAAASPLPPGFRVNRRIYEEACALYARFLPLAAEHLAERPHGNICFTGAGMGGALASLLMVLSLRRGLCDQQALLPTYAFNAPGVLASSHDTAAWGAAAAATAPHSDAAADVEDVVSSLLRQGVLGELGVPQEGIKNVVTWGQQAELANGWARGATMGVVNAPGGRRLEILAPLGSIVVAR